MKLLSLLLGLAFVSTANAGVTLAGDEVDAGMYRTIDNGYGVGRVAGYGLEAPFIVQEGPADGQKYSDLFTLDVDGKGFTIAFMNTPYAWQPGTVLRLQDLDFSDGSALASLAVDSNLTGYGVTTGADFLDISLGDVVIGDGAYFTGTFATAGEVPEPASAALMALALAGAAGASRRARRAPAL